MKEWKEHFDELLNRENQYEEYMPMMECPIKGVTIEEINEVMSKMKKGKVPGPSGLIIDLLKGTKEDGIQALYKIIQDIESEE